MDCTVLKWYDRKREEKDQITFSSPHQPYKILNSTIRQLSLWSGKTYDIFNSSFFTDNNELISERCTLAWNKILAFNGLVSIFKVSKLLNSAIQSVEVRRLIIVESKLVWSCVKQLKWRNWKQNFWCQPIHFTTLEILHIMLTIYI